MSEQQNPLGGDSGRGPRDERGDASGFASFAQLSQLAQLVSSLDAQGLVSGVGQALTWARESVVTPHASHTDPAQHPECVICRGMTMVQGAMPAAGPDAAAERGPAMAEPVRWIPVSRLPRWASEA